MNNLTFSIIKPGFSSRSGEINAFIQSKGFEIVAQKMILMSKKDAENFYSIHKSRPFFNDLVKYMISGPVIVMVLKKENAVSDFRVLMGATNPQESHENTIRKKFGIDIEKNVIHGSDSDENAKIEIYNFFSNSEIFL